MPNERILVGGGVNYDPTLSGSNLSNYYKFTCVNETFPEYGNIAKNTTEYSLYKFGINGIVGVAMYTGGVSINKLFTGILPYQNLLDCGLIQYNPYVNAPNGAPKTSVVPIPIFMNFNLPIVLTKYRLWNGFVSNSYSFYSNYGSGYDASLDTPRDWNIQGSNDNINWTTIDTRSNEPIFPAATNRLCSNSPYVEYIIQNPSAYKSYKLTVTKAGRSSKDTVCNKSGCTDYFNSYQIGEIQLLGYEDPTTSCSLHGVDTLFPGSSYPNLDVTKKFNFAQAFKLDNDYGGRWDVDEINANGYISSGTSKNGFIDFSTNVKITSYKLRRYSNILTSWQLYGSSDNLTWNLLDNRSSGYPDNITYSSYSITSPRSYRYYKFVISGGIDSCGKSGCFYRANIQDIQFVGTIG